MSDNIHHRTGRAGTTSVDDAPPVLDERFSDDTGDRNKRTAKGRHSERGARRWLSWLALLLIVVAAAYGGVRLTDHRLLAQQKVDVGSALLVASPVTVGAPGNGEVIALFVQPQQTVKKGDPVARMNLHSSDSTGHPVTTQALVTAPVSGIVSNVESPQGSTIKVSDPIVTMYDPGTERFETSVDMATLKRVSTGMSATLSSPATDEPVPAVVDHVVPDPGIDPKAPERQKRLLLVLRPDRPQQVARLVPGLLFSVTVDTGSTPKQSPGVLQVNR